MKEGLAFKARLTTCGRVSGEEHRVWLRAVIDGGKIFFSRHRPDSDWFKNAMRDSRVKVEIDGVAYEGVASPVHDEAVARRVSELKYPGEERAREKRVAIAVTLCEV